MRSSRLFLAAFAVKMFDLMNILLLGRGKTGSQVAEVARQRGHEVQVAGAAENASLRRPHPGKATRS